MSIIDKSTLSLERKETIFQFDLNEDKIRDIQCFVNTQKKQIIA